MIAEFAEILSDHDPVVYPCESKRSAYGRLARYGYRTRQSMGRNTDAWLLSPRTAAESYTAAAKWEAAELRIWGPIPKPPRQRLPTEDVGPLVTVQLPEGVWAWLVGHIGERRRRGESTVASAIRRAFLRARQSKGSA